MVDQGLCFAEEAIAACSFLNSGGSCQLGVGYADCNACDKSFAVNGMFVFDISFFA